MRKAFTLAEVLITLGIIGVVAALTMPSLIAKHKEKVTVVKVKKSYSVLQTAYQHAIQEYGDSGEWFSSSDNETVMTKKFFDKIVPYLKISKYCGSGSGCLTKGRPIQLLQGGTFGPAEDTDTREIKFILSDGMAVTGIFSYPKARNDEPFGKIMVDVDNFKGPFVMGKDVFVFEVTQNRIYPSGISGTFYPFDQDMCKITAKNNRNGFGCAAWVIYNENMDYLHCNDLKWNGKTKCK